VSSLSVEQMIESHFMATVDAISTLFAKGLYGHTLILIYSEIDTCGLLDAPDSQVSASGDSFKNWVKKYMLGFPGVNFNEVDLWGARCAVLHTFTSESDISRAGKARELQYYSGDDAHPDTQRLLAFTANHQGGGHLAVHYGVLCEAFFSGLKAFALDLDSKCKASKVSADRMRKILLVFPL